MILTAKLWLFVHLWICHDFDANLASAARVSLHLHVLPLVEYIADCISSRTIVFGLGNGGTAGLIYLYIIVVVFFTLVNISMAEMASMAPTAGELTFDLSRRLSLQF